MMLRRLTVTCILLAVVVVLSACQLLAGIEDRELVGGGGHGGDGPGGQGGSPGQGGSGVGGGTGGSAGGPALGCALDLVGGSFQVCARRTDDTTLCWGGNNSGQVGLPGASE